MLRIAFANPDNGIAEISREMLTELVNRADFQTRWTYRYCEYVDNDSPHKAWRDIRVHGFSCRAFVEVSLRGGGF